MNIPTTSFIKKIKSIEDADYGDFMRKANVYFVSLAEELGSHIPEGAKQKLSEIQDYLQYKPNWNRDKTIQRLSKDILDLEMMIDGVSRHEESKNLTDFHPHLHP